LIFLAVGNVVAALLDHSDTPVASSVGMFQQDPEPDPPIEQPTVRLQSRRLTLLPLQKQSKFWETLRRQAGRNVHPKASVYTFVIVSDQLKNDKTKERTLSLYETTYKGGKFASDRGGFAKNVDSERTPLMRAEVVPKFWTDS
jgi:hypothetical protein